MSNIEFESPAARVVKQFSEDGTEQFKIPVNLPDITFLRALSVQGRLRYFQGSSVGAGTIVTITPTIGETIFIYQITMSATSGAGITNFTITNDGSTRAVIGLVSGGTGTLQYNILDSLVGNSSKTITVANDANNAQATILGWSENTSRIRDVTI